MWVSENRVLKSIFGPNTREITSGRGKFKWSSSFIILTVHYLDVQVKEDEMSET
jgi:hypothetical protein